MRHPGVNPYLPLWEYVPDGEPHVFGDRVYLYGSHDRAGGYNFCLNDYVGWSAPVTDLSDWRYEGVLYRRTQDPRNADGRQCLYAPDVARAGRAVLPLLRAGRYLDDLGGRLRHPGRGV